MLNNQSASISPVAQLTAEANTMSNQVQLFDSANLVSVRDGKCFCTSLMIAEKFEKDHANVLKVIRSQMASLPEDFSRVNFNATFFTDSFNRQQPMFELTRDGFSLIVMGFTGEKALQWKIKFIEAFNAMEAQLRESMPNFNDPVAAARAWADAEEKRRAAEEARLVAERKAKENAEALAVTTNELEIANDQLGYAREFRSCIAMGDELYQYFDIKHKEFAGDYFYANMGKFMTRLCNGLIVPEKTFEIKKEYVPNARYNWINVYSVAAWDYFFYLCQTGQISSKTKFIGKAWRCQDEIF